MEWRENGIFKKDRKNFNKSIYFIFTYNWNFLLVYRELNIEK